MADDKKACKSTEESKNNKVRAKTPVGQDKKKSSPEIAKDKKPKFSPNGKSVIEEENQVVEMKNDNVNEKEETSTEPKSPSDSELEFTKGLRVEVKDLPTDTWYVAKVVEIEGPDVLIHYVNWAARHDEWITMDSNRIRPLSAAAKSPPAPAVVVTPVVSRKRGRPVGSGLKHKPPKAAAVSTATQDAAVAATTETPDVENKDESVTYVVGEDVKALWTDSRKYPAKVVEVLENGTYKVVFSDGFEKVMARSKISKSKPGETVVATAPPPPPVVQDEPVMQIDDPDSKEGRRQRKRKINVAELFRRKPSTSKTYQPESPAAVPAKKIKIEEPEERMLSPSAEPTTQKRGRGRPPRKTLEATLPVIAAAVEVKNEPADNIMIELDGEISTPVETAAEPTSSKTATPPKESEKKVNTVPLTPKVEPPVVAANIPLPADIALEIPDEPKDIFIGSLKIERVGDNLKCPKEGCGKLLRKEKLIMMHIKHYHQDLKKEMDVVPQVLDYAYARYIGDLPSTASMIRNFSNPVPSSGHSTSSAAPKKKTVKTPIKSAPEIVKVEEQPPPAITSSLTPRIQLGKSNSCKTSSTKTGLKVKTLLPVRKSLPPKVTEPKEKSEPKKSLEMPVLKKALMTPPMNSSTPANQRPSEIPKDVKPLKLPIHLTPKKSPRKSPRKDHLVEDGAMELINCVCGYTEEDGLIIQCDLCFCWQHGSCNLIDREDDVPDKFVCHICRSPLKERKSRKYSHDQDWLKKGTLPRLPVLRLNEKFERSSLEKALKETQDIASATLNLGEIMHSLKIQINIAQKKDHPKLYLWSKEWAEIENLTGKLEAKEAAPPLVESAPQKLEVALPDIPSFEPIPGTSACGQAPVDFVDLHPALKLPLSAMEIEHLATTMAQSIPAAEPTVEAHHPVILHPPKAPEPEAAIKPGKCRVLLLKHIQQLQEQLEARINELETRNVALERRAPQIYGKEVSDSRVKETLRMLQRDVGSVHKIGNFAKKS